MKRIFLLLFLFSAGCSDSPADKITNAMCFGAVPISDVSIKFKSDQPGRNGQLIDMEGVVPFDIKKEQVKPTILAAFKDLLKKHPESKDIFVGLLPDRRLHQFVGHASYHSGTVSIHYGIPSEAEMDKKNANIGKSVPGGIFGEDKEHMIIIDHPRLYRPDRATFEKIIWIKEAVAMHDNKSINSKSLCKKISTASKTPLADVEQLYWLMNFYYSSGFYGEESIRL